MKLHLHVRRIRWSIYEQSSPILLQDKNGPCPLIALVNTLLLSDDIEQRTSGMDNGKEELTIVIDENAVDTEISEKADCQKDRLDVSQLRGLLLKNVGRTVEISEIMSCLGDLLLNVRTLDSVVMNRFFESLPLLHTGLEVNPNLTTGGFDSNELATQIFRAFNLNFVHGWCRYTLGDSKIDMIFEKYQTFEAIQEYLLTYPNEIEEKSQVETWLSESATQLTEYGLLSIDKRMRPDSLAIFFRNNHFSTVYKAQNNDLYLLITDDAFLKRSSFVWQSINSVSGKDDLYFAGDFTPLLDGVGVVETAQDSDYENIWLARKLQEKEDSAYARVLSKNFDKKKLSNFENGKNKSVEGLKKVEVLSGNEGKDSRKHRITLHKGKGTRESCVIV